MITSPLTIVPARLAYSEAIQSEYRYYATAAREDALPGARIFFVPDYAHISAGCIVYLEEPSRIQAEARAWIGQLESRLRHWGTRWSRVYFQPKHESLETAFTWWGYACRREWILFAPPADFAGWETDGCNMQPIRSNLDWSANLHFHRNVQASAKELGTDGFPCEAAHWVELMRRKAEAGAVEAYQLWQRQEVIAEVSIVGGDNTLCLKNLTVSPAWQQRGIARQVACWLRLLAKERDKRGVVVLSVEGSVNDRAYFNAGFDPCEEILLWSRDLMGSENKGKTKPEAPEVQQSIFARASRASTI